MKDKKKTLTISTGFKKSIDASSFKKKDGKKSYSIEKKKNFKNSRDTGKGTQGASH